jgi:hypothetical protein
MRCPITVKALIKMVASGLQADQAAESYSRDEKLIWAGHQAD